MPASPTCVRGAANALLAVLLAAASGLPALAGPVAVQVVDGAGKPLAGAVVFLESREASTAARPLPGQQIAQAGRQFIPRVTVVTKGTAVGFPNRDTVRHHVYSFSPTKKFEIKLYVGTPTEPVVFDHPGIAVLGCNIHDQMAAWVVVVDSPWYGQTGADGSLAWPAVPAGSYQLRTWHPALAAGAPAATQVLKVLATVTQAAVGLTGLTP